MLTNILYPWRNIKFLENKAFNAILTEKTMGLLFRLLNKNQSFSVQRKGRFFLYVFYLCTNISSDTIHLLKKKKKTMLHVSQDGQRTRISHLSIFLAFQVKDLVKKIYTPDTQVEGSLGLLMWPHSSRDITGSCWFGHDEFLPHQMCLRLCRDFAISN